MIDIRQTPDYANYLKLLGWKTEKISGGQIFVKKFPLIGSIIKVQRIKPPLPFAEIEKIAKQNRAFQILIDQEINKSKRAKEQESRIDFKINQKPYFPTKTIQVDLTKPEPEIFNSFSEAKRRAVRKAEKNGIMVKQAKDFREFLWLKKHSLWEKNIIPFATDNEIKNLYLAFYPKSAKILIAYFQEKPVAGIFLLHSNKVAYYWLAAAAKEGKKMFAPSLLTWEAFKLAKKLNCEIFDFEGIYDERYPVKAWLGFTKFKEGFGGKEVYFPPSLIKNRLGF